ncbi:MAG: AI-2E family transporter [Alphaproteobacteria bacterium]|nr:AI-2E family transporter [Alphaproteobacteria bacterium]
MTAEKQVRFWLIGLVVAVLLLWLLRGILLPFVAAMAVAYFLDPAADKLEEWGCSRALATSIITAIFFLGVILAMILILPLLQQQIVAFAAKIPGYLEALQSYVLGLVQRLQTSVSPEDLEDLRKAATGYLDDALSLLGRLLGGLWSGGLALVNLLSLIFITPVVCFYLLRDWDKMLDKIDSWLPRRNAEVIREQLRLIDETLAGFVRGQGLVCLVLGTFYAVALSAAGLEFGLVVGLGAGLISFIPYVGSALGLVVSVGLAFAQFDEWQRIAIIAGIFLVGQFVEGNFLSPKLVGDRVKLHAVWIIFALLAGGALLGFVGILLAVPVAAVIGVLGRFALSRYLESPLYATASDGEGAGSGAPPDPPA